MTSPSADSDLFICWASFSLSPTASDFSTLSLPAKSTRWRQPLRMELETNSFPWTWTVKTLQKNSQNQKPLVKIIGINNNNTQKNHKLQLTKASTYVNGYSAHLELWHPRHDSFGQSSSSQEHLEYM